jgi:hypothetical protein
MDVGVDAYGAEVDAESRLEEGAGGRIEGTAALAQGVGDGAQAGAWGVGVRGLPAVCAPAGLLVLATAGDLNCGMQSPGRFP